MAITITKYVFLLNLSVFMKIVLDFKSQVEKAAAVAKEKLPVPGSVAKI